MNHPRTAAGMTLPELMVGMGIFSLLLFVLIAAYFSYTNVFSVQVARNEVQTESIRVQRVIDSAVRGATKILSSRTIGGTAYQTDENTVVLETPAVNSDGSVILNSFDTIVYDRDGAAPTRLNEVVDAAPASSRTAGTRRLSSIVSDLSFQYNTPNVVNADEVTAVLVLTKPGGTKTFSLTTETNARLRNK